MKIIDIAEETAVLLQLEDVLALPEFAGRPNATQNPKTQIGPLTARSLALLTRCVNYALRLIAGSYIPQKASEKVHTTNGEILYSSLKHSCIEVTKVTGKNGEVAFKTYPTFISIFSKGDFEVFYNYVPSVKTLDDEINDFCPQLTKEIIAYLAASEYCAISSLPEESQMWEVKFKDATRRLIKSRSRHVKMRPWL